MKKRSNFFLLPLVAIIVCVPFSTSAQVTIGGNQAPQPFSILELVVPDPENRPQGFRLPRMTTNERREMQNSPAFHEHFDGAARGLQIYNLDNNCVETWNGTIWLLDCMSTTPGQAPIPPQPFPPFRPEDPWVPDVYCDGIGGRLIPGIRFAPRNLGADPRYNTAIAQMRYLAVAPFDVNDATVFGGLFQWGRSAHQYAWQRNPATGRHERRLDGTTLPRRIITNVNPNNVEIDQDTGQPVTVNNHNADFVFFSLNTHPNWPLSHDWQPVARGEDRNLGLWGTPEPPHVPFDVPAGITCHELGGVTGLDGRCYQIPVRTANDPCPPGWRVPTQDELERIGPYDCNPLRIDWASNAATGAGIPLEPQFARHRRFAQEPGVVVNLVYNLIWIRVVCRDGMCHFSQSSGQVNAGYALYEFEEWYAFTVGLTMGQMRQINLLQDGAPEPFLFLPLGGLRNRSGVMVNTDQGYYWTSSRRDHINFNTSDWQTQDLRDGSTTPFALRLERNSFDMRFGGSGERDAVHGLSIRCVTNLSHIVYPDEYDWIEW